MKKNNYKALDKNICKSCGHKIQPEKIWFDDNGYGYSTKLGKCTECNKITILAYINDKNLDVNNDKRYYTYR